MLRATGVYWKPVWNILSDGAFELIVISGHIFRPIELRQGISI
jgi:hypothetical protein